MENINFYGAKRTAMESMSRKNLFSFLAVCLFSYCILLACGNFGPLPYKVDTMQCGLGNNCTLHDTMASGVQVCQHGGIHDDFKVQAQFYLKPRPTSAEYPLKLNLTIGVVGSALGSLQSLCESSTINIAKHLP